MQLPGEVREFPNILGFTWPAADETKLLDLAQIWTSLSERVDAHVNEAGQAAGRGRLEQRLRQGLPPDYRNYLLTRDGGRLQDNDQALKVVFGVREDVPDWANMYDKLDIFHGRLPEWLVPVAQDEYGNLIALSTRDEDYGSYGSVWFWDHEEEADDDEAPTEDNIECRASSWAEFMLGLEPVE